MFPSPEPSWKGLSTVPQVFQTSGRELCPSGLFLWLSFQMAHPVAALPPAAISPFVDRDAARGPAARHSNPGRCLGSWLCVSRHPGRETELHPGRHAEHVIPLDLASVSSPGAKVRPVTFSSLPSLHCPLIIIQCQRPRVPGQQAQQWEKKPLSSFAAPHCRVLLQLLI